jgi:NADH-quinone oxidoreductase subunit L
LSRPIVPVTVNPAQEAFEHKVHESHLPAMITSLIVALSGIALAFGMYKRRMIDPDRVMAERFRPLYSFLLNKWYFDEIYEKVDCAARGPSHRAHDVLVRFTCIVDGAVNGVAYHDAPGSRV